MSQFYIQSTGSGPLPPTVPTSFTTDVHDNTTAGPGTAVPSANVLNVLGGSTNQNNNNGIRTDANANNSNNLFVELTNRLTGAVTTANATPTTIVSFALGSTPGVYTFSGDFTAFDITDTAGASYSVVSGIRTTGAAAIEIGTQFDTNFEEAALAAADVDVTVSGNSVIFQVTGIATTTIDWDALFTYRFVS